MVQSQPGSEMEHSAVQISSLLCFCDQCSVFFISGQANIGFVYALFSLSLTLTSCWIMPYGIHCLLSHLLPLGV